MNVEQYSIMTYPGGHAVQYVTSVFECVRESGEIRISHESTDIGYFAPNDLPEVTPPSVRLRIKDALANRAEAFIR